MRRRPKGEILFHKRWRVPSNTLPCQTSSPTRLATGLESAVPGATTAVPCVSPVGASPVGLRRKRSSRSAWDIARSRSTEAAKVLISYSRSRAPAPMGFASTPVHQGLEVSFEVRPAQGPPLSRELIIGRPATRPHHLGKRGTQQRLHHRRPSGATVEAPLGSASGTGPPGLGVPWTTPASR